MLKGISAGINDFQSTRPGGVKAGGSQPRCLEASTVRFDSNAVAICFRSVQIFYGLPSSVIFYEETRLVTPNCFFMPSFRGDVSRVKKSVKGSRYSQ